MTAQPSIQAEREDVALLPCPFCGKSDAFVEQSTFASSYVICNGCSSRGPDSCQDSDEEEEPGRDAAIAAWNTRPDREHAPDFALTHPEVYDLSEVTPRDDDAETRREIEAMVATWRKSLVNPGSWKERLRDLLTTPRSMPEEVVEACQADGGAR